MLHELPFYKIRFYALIVLFAAGATLLTPANAIAQGGTDTSYGGSMTLDQCIAYALTHQPGINVSQLNTRIAHTNNAINLSGWLPQVNASANVVHYNTLPTTLSRSDSLGGTGGTTGTTTTIPIHTGVVNTVIPEITVSQAIFNPQLLYAAKAAPLYVRQSELITDSTKIYVVTNVSKTFYSLLLTLEQIDVLKEDTARLARNVKDTYHQFVGGIVDETDYDEAMITYNNSLGQLRQTIENVRPQYALLKQYMGYPPKSEFNVAFDTVQMMQDIGYDTTQALQFEKRIEYQQIQTLRQLQHATTGYYGLAFLPTISGFFNYYYEFENNNAPDLFSKAYPYSYFGLSLNIPIFTGFSRLENVHKSRLQEQVINWYEVDLKARIYTEYSNALASYKSNLYTWNLLKDNRQRAQNVYRIVSLQYKQGIVAYLNMIVAESNLISAEIGYTNSLFQLLQSKVDLEKATGNISYNSPIR